MSRSQLVFFAIVGSALLIVGVGLGLQAFGGDSGGNGGEKATPVATSGPSLTLQVAVSPVIEPWLTQAVRDYQATNPQVSGRPVSIQITAQDSLEPWRDGSSIWSAANHPTLWIPDTAYSLSYGQEAGLRFEVVEASLARTPIIWGAYQTRGAALERHYGDFTSANVQAAAVEERWSNIGGASQWQYIKLGFARPNSVDSGFASLLALAGGFEPDNWSDPALRTWLTPVIDAVPNFSTLGKDPASVMATRTLSTAEIALLPESQWLGQWDNLAKNESVALYYPAASIILDFPIAVWSSDRDEQAAAKAFAQFLLTNPQQQAAANVGLRPVKNVDISASPRFTAAGNQWKANLPAQITPPTRAEALALLRWFASYRTAS